MEKEKLLILSVDRDNDIGEKAGVKGPIIGRKDVLEAGVSLGLADPEDSDFNAIFQCVKVYDEMKNKYKSEIAVLTGNRNVGIESDKMITFQLNKVLDKFKADYVVLVTDGTEDENVMPIIQSKVPILSVKRVVVKQSEQLESSYFKIKDFIQESLDNPKYSRLVFGIPAIIFILLGIFGIEGAKIIIGVLGVYLFIKGFKLESYITGAAEELKTSLTRRKFAFFLYMLGIAFLILAMYKGYEGASLWLNQGIFEIMAGFVSYSIYFFFIGASILWTGINVRVRKRSGRRVLGIVTFGFAISLIAFNAAEFILRPEISMGNFIFSIAIGFVLVIVTLFIELKS